LWRVQGHFVKPTIAEVSPGASVLQEEVFAPIMYLVKVKDLDEAIAINNDVPQVRVTNHSTPQPPPHVGHTRGLARSWCVTSHVCVCVCVCVCVPGPVVIALHVEPRGHLQVDRPRGLGLRHRERQHRHQRR
jgi:hypothetical protein